jgi:acyl-CoA thioesterase FadM
MAFKAVVYQAPVKIRFSDIDRYQHVNTTYYPDYVFSSRFDFMKKTWNLTADHFEKMGIGFYTIRFESHFLKPISASVTEVLITSSVSEVDRSLIKVQFKITDLEESQHYSKGTFDMFAIDLKTQKPLKEMPAEATTYMWENTP